MFGPLLTPGMPTIKVRSRDDLDIGDEQIFRIDLSVSQPDDYDGPRLVAYYFITDVDKFLRLAEKKRIVSYCIGKK